MTRLRWILAIGLLCHSVAQASSVLIGGGHQPLANEAALEAVFADYQTLLKQIDGTDPHSFYANGAGSTYAVRNHNTRWVTAQTDPLSLLFYPDDLQPNSFRATRLNNVLPTTKLDILDAIQHPVGTASTRTEPSLIVMSGHGQKSSRATNNALRLWMDSPLSTEEIRSAVVTRNPEHPVVYIASQCYSGSLHDIALDTVAQSETPTATMCGFTSVPRWDLTEECTAAIQTHRYDEYGRILLNQRRAPQEQWYPFSDLNNDGRLSLYESHLTVLASMQDRMDIPLSSSEAFLLSSEHWYERWSLSLSISEDNPYRQVALAIPVSMDAAAGSREYFRELNRKLNDAANQQATAAEIEYDNMDEAVLLRQAIYRDLQNEWPQLAAPYSSAAQQLLSNQAEDVRRWIVNHPEIERLYDHEIRARGLSDDWLKATRSVADLRRLHQTWQLAIRYEQVNAEPPRSIRRRQYLALRDCEHWTPRLP